jgi:hypothetical protein
LHHPSLYRAARTTGYLYPSHLRALVRERLGVEWGPVLKGAADPASQAPKRLQTHLGRGERDDRDRLRWRYCGLQGVGATCFGCSRGREEDVDVACRSPGESASAAGVDGGALAANMDHNPDIATPARAAAAALIAAALET